MKKQLAMLLGLCVCTSAFAASQLDESVFVDPNISLAGKSALVNRNIGCNIPSTQHVVSNDGFKVTGLGAHFRDLAGKVKTGNRAVITAPASYDVVFTDGTRSDEEIYAHIDDVLAAIGESQDETLIEKQLSSLQGVNRATFARRDGMLMLVTDQRGLQVGETVWRKTPEGAEKNIYHSEEEYLVALKNAGWTVEEIKRPSFYGQVKWKQFVDAREKGEKSLGAAYMDHNPFTIYYVTKA